MPRNPTETLESDRVKVSLVEPVPSQRQSEEETLEQSKQTNDRAIEAVPAMGWVFSDRGEVTLTAYSTNETPNQHRQKQVLNNCSKYEAKYKQ